MSDKKDKIIEEMREAQARKEAIMKRTGRTARGEQGQDQPKEDPKPAKPEKSAEERVKELEAKLAKQKQENAELEKKKVTKLSDFKEKVDQDILKDQDPNFFTKQYEYDIAKGGKTKFIIKMHAPSIAEQATIQQQYTDLTQGRGEGFVRQAQELFLAIAYFRTVGDNVPDWFIDVENTYRTDILLDVWIDYQDWLVDYLDTKAR